MAPLLSKASHCTQRCLDFFLTSFWTLQDLAKKNKQQTNKHCQPRSCAASEGEDCKQCSSAVLSPTPLITPPLVCFTLLFSSPLIPWLR